MLFLCSYFAKTNRPVVNAMQFHCKIDRLIFLAATMPLSATFLNIFDTNCCCRLKTIQDVCQVSSVTVCFNPRINPGILGLSKLNPEFPGLQKWAGIAFHSWRPSCGDWCQYFRALT